MEGCIKREKTGFIPSFLALAGLMSFLRMDYVDHGAKVQKNPAAIKTTGLSYNHLIFYYGSSKIQNEFL